MGVDNMAISKYHAYQPMVRMWFTGRFLEEECDYLNKCPNSWRPTFAGHTIRSGYQSRPCSLQIARVCRVKGADKQMDIGP